MKTYFVISAISACLGAGVTHVVHVVYIKDPAVVEAEKRSKDAGDEYFRYVPQKDRGNRGFK